MIIIPGKLGMSLRKVYQPSSHVMLKKTPAVGPWTWGSWLPPNNPSPKNLTWLHLASCGRKFYTDRCTKPPRLNCWNAFSFKENCLLYIERQLGSLLSPQFSVAGTLLWFFWTFTQASWQEARQWLQATKVQWEGYKIVAKDFQSHSWATGNCQQQQQDRELAFHCFLVHDVDKWYLSYYIMLHIIIFL